MSNEHRHRTGARFFLSQLLSGGTRDKGSLKAHTTAVDLFPHMSHAAQKGMYLELWIYRNLLDSCLIFALSKSSYFFFFFFLLSTVVNKKIHWKLCNRTCWPHQQCPPLRLHLAPPLSLCLPLMFTLQTPARLPPGSRFRPGLRAPPSTLLCPPAHPYYTAIISTTLFKIEPRSAGALPSIM